MLFVSGVTMINLQRSVISLETVFSTTFMITNIINFSKVFDFRTQRDSIWTNYGNRMLWKLFITVRRFVTNQLHKKSIHFRLDCRVIFFSRRQPLDSKILLFTLLLDPNLYSFMLIVFRQVHPNRDNVYSASQSVFTGVHIGGEGNHVLTSWSTFHSHHDDNKFFFRQTFHIISYL